LCRLLADLHLHHLHVHPPHAHLHQHADLVSQLWKIFLIGKGYLRFNKFILRVEPETYNHPCAFLHPFGL
jgi:hypothetical protein